MSGSKRRLEFLCWVGACVIAGCWHHVTVAKELSPIPATPWGSERLAGPAADWKVLCKDCTQEKKYPSKVPFLEVLLLGDRSYQEFPTPPELVFYKLAVRTEAGWFLLADLGTAGPRCGGDAPFWTQFWNDKPDYVSRTPPETPLFVLSFDAGANDIDDHKVLACGVAADHSVACTFPSILVRNTGSYKGSWTSTHRWLGDGSLEISSDKPEHRLLFAPPAP